MTLDITSMQYQLVKVIFGQAPSVERLMELSMFGLKAGCRFDERLDVFLRADARSEVAVFGVPILEEQ